MVEKDRGVSVCLSCNRPILAFHSKRIADSSLEEQKNDHSHTQCVSPVQYEFTLPLTQQRGVGVSKMLTQLGEQVNDMKIIQDRQNWVRDLSELERNALEYENAISLSNGRGFEPEFRPNQYTHQQVESISTEKDSKRIEVCTTIDEPSDKNEGMSVASLVHKGRIAASDSNRFTCAPISSGISKAVTSTTQLDYRKNTRSLTPSTARNTPNYSRSSTPISRMSMNDATLAQRYSGLFSPTPPRISDRQGQKQVYKGKIRPQSANPRL